MQTNYDRQAKLAKAAPLPELEALSKGANPRLVQPFVALGTLNARMAQMQSNKMLQGATAPGSIPTLRDKIEQSLQQMKMQAQQQPQPQQQPSGMPQMPEGTPGPQMQPQAEEQPQGEAQSVMQARAGGLAQLPVNDQMFGYAGGGIIAFNGNERSDVPRPIGEETPLSPEERARLERELLMRIVGERSRAGIPDEVPANLKNPRMDVTDLDFLSIPGMEKSDVLQRAMDSISQKREPESSTPTPTSSPTRTLARPIGQEAPLSPEERARLERELEMRLIGERARAGATGETNRPATDDAASRIPGQSVRAPSASPVERDDAASRIPGQSVRAPASGIRADSSELGRNISNTLAALPGAGAVKGFFGGIRGALGGLGSLTNREDNQGLVANSFAPTDASAQSTSTVKPAPTGKPQLQGPRTLVGDAADEHARLAKAHENFTGGQKLVGGMTYGQAVETARQKNGGTLTREQLEIINRRFAGAEADSGIKLLPGATPGKNVAKPSVTTSTDTPAQDEEGKLMDLLTKQYGPQPAVESAEDRLKKRDEYVKNAPDSAEALAMIKHLDRMAKRYEANDEAEKAQQARNASNNLATFLMNTRGSSLGIAAGKANAALQPLLSDQETRRQTYQKQRDEQEMFLGKARYELAQAERLRKEGRYSDAEKHEMEAKKLQEQARGHNIQGLTSLLNAAGVRADRAAGREQQYLMHRERMGELSLQRQRMADEANRIKEQGERTQRENAYARQSKDVLERIRKAQTLLSMPNLSKEQKTKTETLLEGYQREDNDLYERIVVRGDKDYRPSPKGSGGNSALTKKADQIVGVK